MSDLTCQLLHPAWLWLLLLSPLACLRLPNMARRLPLPDGQGTIARDTIWHRAYRWRLLLGLAIALFSLAMARIQLSWLDSRLADDKPNLACVLDVSGSMEARDWPDSLPPPGDLQLADAPPSRLDLAKDAVARLCLQDVAEHYALVAFANTPVLVCPLVSQGRWLRERLPQLQVQQFEDGTAIGEALACALKTLASSARGRPAFLVLFSDGVDHTGEGGLSPEEAAQLAQRQGIILQTVGIGGPHGYHAVGGENGGVIWKAAGETPDFQRLQSLAQITGGQFFSLADVEKLPEFLNSLRRQWSKTIVASPVRREYSTAPLCLLGALLCAVLALAARWRHPLFE